MNEIIALDLVGLRDAASLCGPGRCGAVSEPSLWTLPRPTLAQRQPFPTPVTGNGSNSYKLFVNIQPETFSYTDNSNLATRATGSSPNGFQTKVSLFPLLLQSETVPRWKIHHLQLNLLRGSGLKQNCRVLFPLGGFRSRYAKPLRVTRSILIQGVQRDLQLLPPKKSFFQPWSDLDQVKYIWTDPTTLVSSFSTWLWIVKFYHFSSDVDKLEANYFIVLYSIEWFDPVVTHIFLIFWLIYLFEEDQTPQ